jgi:molecular chaperone GrpE
MTSARKPAGAPDGWNDRKPAGAADAEQVEEEGREQTGGPGAFLPHTGKKAPTEAEDESAAAVDADLDALVADTKRERDEYLELAQRTKADFENYRKRAARDAAEAERRGTAKLARELVPIVDNLERALKAAEDDSELAKGVALVLRELEETLRRAGVEAYDPIGEPFDPTWHEALSTQPQEGTDPGMVVETLERGYRLDGQVLRAARVVVSE